MILSDLNYLEPVSENNTIVGGIIAVAGTDLTIAAAKADAGDDGIDVLALSEAIGDYISNSIELNTYVKPGIFNIASAEARASSTALRDDDFDSSYSHASSLYTSKPHSEMSRNFGLSISVDNGS